MDCTGKYSNAILETEQECCCSLKVRGVNIDPNLFFHFFHGFHKKYGPKNAGFYFFIFLQEITEKNIAWGRCGV